MLDDSVNEIAESFSVLFVDDEPSVLVSLKRLCRPLKLEVYTAEGGEEALTLLRSKEIDLIVSDMRMPGMTGAELLEQVAIQSPSTVRLLLTGYSDIESTISAINGGKIFGYISKPWDNKDLQQTLIRALNTKKLEREKEHLESTIREKNRALETLNSELEEKVNVRTDQIKKSLIKLENFNIQLKHSYTGIVEVLANVIELRGIMNLGHGRRVAKIAQALAVEMRLDEDTVEQVYLAGLIHDIGKLSLPDELITTPHVKLDKEQRADFDAHGTVGEAILSPIYALREAASFILHQNRNANGSGFPSGDEDIPEGAQFIRIASDYDDLIQGSTAIAKCDPEKAERVMRDRGGIEYSRGLTDVFFKVISSLDLDEEPREQRTISVEELEDGMELAQDVYTAKGVLLLQTGLIFDEHIIEKVTRFAKQIKGDFKFFIFV